MKDLLEYQTKCTFSKFMQKLDDGSLFAYIIYAHLKYKKCLKMLTTEILSENIFEQIYINLYGEYTIKHKNEWLDLYKEELEHFNMLLMSFFGSCLFNPECENLDEYNIYDYECEDHYKNNIKLPIKIQKLLC